MPSDSLSIAYAMPEIFSVSPGKSKHVESLSLYVEEFRCGSCCLAHSCGWHRHDFSAQFVSNTSDVLRFALPCDLTECTFDRRLLRGQRFWPTLCCRPDLHRAHSVISHHPSRKSFHHPKAASARRRLQCSDPWSQLYLARMFCPPCE